MNPIRSNPKLVAAASILFGITAQAAINLEELPAIDAPSQSVQAKPAISALSALTLCGLRPGDPYTKAEQVFHLPPRRQSFSWTGCYASLSPLPAGLSLATLPVKGVSVNMYASPSQDYVPAQFCSISAVEIECLKEGGPNAEMLGKGLLKSLAAQLGEPTNKEINESQFSFTWGKSADGLQLIVRGHAELGYYDKINRAYATFTLKNDGLVSALVKKNEEANRKKALTEKFNQTVPVFNAPIK